MPQFDFVSNYFLLIIFFLFFVFYLILMIVCLNSLYKYIHILRVNKEQIQSIKTSLKFLEIQKKKKKMWYAYNKK